MQAGICFVMAPLLATYVALKKKYPDFPLPSLAYILDHCKVPHWYAAGCGGGDIMAVLR